MRHPLAEGTDHHARGCQGNGRVGIWVEKVGDAIPQGWGDHGTPQLPVGCAHCLAPLLSIGVPIPLLWGGSLQI